MSLSFFLFLFIITEFLCLLPFITDWQVQINKHDVNWRLAHGNMKSIGGSKLKHKSFGAPRWVLLQTSE